MTVVSYFLIGRLIENPVALADGYQNVQALDLFLATVVGLVSGILIGVLTEYYTSIIKNHHKMSQPQVKQDQQQILFPA